MNKIRFAAAMVIALMLMPALPAALAEDDLTVATAQRYYKPGEAVAISGVAAAGAAVDVDVTNTLGSVYAVSVTAGTDGAYSASFTLAADARLGFYKVTATAGEEEEDAKFNVVSVLPSEAADSQIQTVKDAKLEVETLLAELEAAGKAIPEGAQASYERGSEFLAKAEALLSEGKPLEALKAGHVALVHFHNAVRITNHAENRERFQARVNSALGKVVRAAERLTERLGERLAEMEAAGEDVADAKVALGEAESHIAAAKALLAEGKTAEARAELGLAKGALEQVYAAVRSHASNGKGPLGFFEHGEKKMEKFENKGNKSSGSNKGGNGNGKGKKD